MASAYLRLAFAAALLHVMGASAWADDPKLEGAAAWRALVGNTVVVTTKAGRYTEYYDPSGDLRRTDGDGATQGRWSQEGDLTCLDYPDDDDRVCLRVSVQGSSGSFTDADGTTDTFQVVPGNASKL